MRPLFKLLWAVCIAYLGYVVFEVVLSWSDIELNELSYSPIGAVDAPNRVYANWADTVHVHETDTLVEIQFCTEVDSSRSFWDSLRWAIMTSGTEPMSHYHWREFGLPMSVDRVGHRSKKAAVLALDSLQVGSLFAANPWVFSDSVCRTIELRAIDGVVVTKFEFKEPHAVSVSVTNMRDRACILVKAKQRTDGSNTNPAL